MARSKREIPHYYLSTTVDLTRALAWLEAANATRPPAQRLLLAALLLKAVARALGEAPEFNGFFTAEGFQPGVRHPYRDGDRDPRRRPRRAGYS